MGVDTTTRGWAFPLEPDARLRSLGWVEDVDAVRQAILLILLTEPGERVMRPDFGCGLRQFLMEPNSPATREQIAVVVSTAIRRFEARVELTDVAVVSSDDPATVVVTIECRRQRDDEPIEVRLAVPVAASGGG